MPHALKPKGDAPSKDKPYAVWDIETANWTRFLICGLYDGSRFETFTSLTTFLKHIVDKYPTWDFFAHFGGRFDHLFLFKEFIVNFYRLRHGNAKVWEIEDMIPRGSGLYSFKVLHKPTDKWVRFFDSSAILPFGLRRLTENFKVEHPKQEIDYTKITKVTPKLVRYLEYDCKGLYECIQKFYQWPIIKKAGPAKSLASQSLKVLQTYLESPIYGFSQKLDRKIRPAYFGGRTEIFRLLFHSKKGERLNCYDVNSLYPYVMSENEYPNEYLGKSHVYSKNDFGFWHCQVDVPKGLYVPPLGIVHRGKFMFPTGKFPAFITTPEVEYCRSLGCRVEVLHGHVFSNGGKFFRPFIKALYRIREKSESGSVDNTLSKLLMNSSYGRFGLRFDREQFVIDNGALGLRSTVAPIEFTVDGVIYRLMIKEVDFDGFSNVAIAAYVTAYARIHMHKLLTACGADIYYTDTDSLFTTREIATSNSLGDVKFEYSCTSAVFLLPKTYANEKKIVMKGFDKKKISDFTLEDFEASLRGDMKRLKILEEPRFQTFRKALRSGELVSMSKGGIRQLRSQYDKRVVLNDYNTRPHHIGE